MVTEQSWQCGQETKGPRGAQRTTSGLLFIVASLARYAISRFPSGSSAISQSYGSRLQPVNTSMKVQPNMNTSDASVTIVPGVLWGRNVSHARHANGARFVVYWLAVERSSHKQRLPGLKHPPTESRTKRDSRDRSPVLSVHDYRATQADTRVSHLKHHSNQGHSYCYCQLIHSMMFAANNLRSTCLERLDQLLAAPEVGPLDGQGSRGRHKRVICLQVAVHNAVVMQVPQPAGELNADVQHVRDSELRHDGQQPEETRSHHHPA